MIQAVTEAPVERAMRQAVQMTPVTQAQFGLQMTTQAQFGLVDSTTTTSRLESSTFTSATTTATSATVHAPLTTSVVPVEPMPTVIPGQPTPYHAVDFCVPVGPDFSLVNGQYTSPLVEVVSVVSVV